MGARDVLGRNELDRINEKSIDLNGYFGSVWSGLDLVLAVTPSASLLSFIPHSPRLSQLDLISIFSI